MCPTADGALGDAVLAVVAVLLLVVVVVVVVVVVGAVKGLRGVGILLQGTFASTVTVGLDCSALVAAER